MADNTDIYALIRQTRAELLGGDADQAHRIIDTYRGVWDKIKPLLDALNQDLADAHTNGEPISLAWLYRQQRYMELLEQSQTAIDAWSASVAGIITAGQASAINLGQTHAEALTLAQIAVPTERAVVAASWNRIPHSAVSHLIGAMGDGLPLADRFENLAPAGVEAIKTALVQGFIVGHGPRETATDIQRATYETSRQIVTDVRNAASIPLNNALMIARTETLRAYREATRESFLANDDVVASWIWVCSFSSRTCAACLSMNGTEHPSTEPMASHVCCRCVISPKLTPHADGSARGPVYESGDDWLRRQPLETQENILGIAGAKAWRDGKLSLSDFVGVKESKEWGRSVYVRSLKGALTWRALVSDEGADTTLAVGRPERPAVPTSIAEAEATIRTQDFETAHVWAADGTYAFGRNGGSSGVQFRDDELASVEDGLFVHNHPSDGAFSNADMHFIEDINPGEFRAVGPKSRYEMRRPEGGWPDNLHEVWFKHVVTAAGRLKKDVDQGKITEEQRSRRSLQIALRKTASDLKLDFTEESK